MEGLLSELLVIIISGCIGAVLGMLIDAFFRFGLGSFSSYWAKRARLHFKNGIRIEMRRSVEVSVSDVPPESLDSEVMRIRDVLFHKCQNVFKDVEKAGDSVIKAEARSGDDMEVEYQFSATPEDETREQGLMVVMIVRVTTPYSHLIDSYTGLWPQLTAMIDTLPEMGRPIIAGDGRASLTVNLKEPMKTLTQTSKVGISGFTGRKETYRIRATEYGITFDGVFTADFGRTLRDLVIWFY